MVKALVANVRVEHTDNAITVQTQGFGTLADFATIVEGEVQGVESPRPQARKGCQGRR